MMVYQKAKESKVEFDEVLLKELDEKLKKAERTKQEI